MSIFIIIGIAAIALGIYECCHETSKWHKFKRKLHATRLRSKRRWEVCEY